MKLTELHAIQHMLLLYNYMNISLPLVTMFFAKLDDCSGVGYQPPVVLPAVQRQVAGVHAVIAHVAKRNTT